MCLNIQISFGCLAESGLSKIGGGLSCFFRVGGGGGLECSCVCFFVLLCLFLYVYKMAVHGNK